MFKKKHAGLLLMTSLTVASASGFASPLMDLISPPLPFVATLSLGPVWESAGDTQTFYLTPSIEKTYAAQHVSHALLDGEVFLGLQRPLREKLEGQLGLAVATTSQAKLSGYVWDDAQA